MAEIQTIPYNLEAEKGVIGGLMLNTSSERAAKAISLLKPESFYFAQHKIIFAEMQNLIRKNQPVDLLTMDSRLKATGALDEIGGFGYLADLSRTPSAANIVAYAEIVRDEAMRRFALTKLQEFQALLLEKSNLTAQERIEFAGKLMTEIADYGRAGKARGLRSANDVAADWIDEYETRQKNPSAVAGLSTGIDDLDRLLGGKKMVKQSLAVVGARPKVGKTSFYATLAVNCVMREKRTALLFSLEMSDKAIFERMFTQLGNVKSAVFYEDPNQLENMGISVDGEISKGMTAIGNLINSDLLFIDDTPAASMAHIRNECRRLKREKGEIGLIAVDYLTLMKAEAAERNDLAYGQITKDLKNLAREMDCVVLLLTQLNRKLEDRGDKRPLPSDSRDTGQIEQECDYWFGLYKDSIYNKNADPTLTEIIVRLNRHGATGTVFVDQRDGAFFNCDQVEAMRRAEIGKPESKQKHKPYAAKGDF